MRLIEARAKTAPRLASATRPSKAANGEKEIERRGSAEPVRSMLSTPWLPCAVLSFIWIYRSGERSINYCGARRPATAEVAAQLFLGPRTLYNHSLGFCARGSIGPLRIKWRATPFTSGQEDPIRCGEAGRGENMPFAGLGSMGEILYSWTSVWER